MKINHTNPINSAYSAEHSNSSNILRSFRSLASRIISSVANHFLDSSHSSSPSSESELNRHEWFFSEIPGNVQVSAFQSLDELMDHLHQASCGINGVAKSYIGFETGEVVEVAKIFLQDLNRCRSDNQQLFINGTRFEWQIGKEAEEHQKEVIQTLYDLFGQDREKLFYVTEVASQNATIDLRHFMIGNFRTQCEAPEGFFPRIEPLGFTVIMHIENDGKVICQLKGAIRELQTQPPSMDDLPEVLHLPSPIFFDFSGVYDLVNQKIEYTGYFRED